ncbi:uncharacterized protein LOC131293719 [Anopheles ziemanni]|uniref:uncharacterized protein LOC131264503 n=1 Tax=Anopheles coustani TaxID=139045 RepID=UPI00265A1F11|nr:uncharacterized protein LOC131264503 [Anopheles coustani]XP_058177773.1 uncharacterized protein LOC131293719 [Anopheles ziemanni]
MDSKKMKHDGNLCRKRKRMLESLDRDIESQMQPFNQAGGAFPTLPDLGIDVTPEEASNLLISSASNDPNPDNSEDEWEDVEEENITAEDYDQDEEDGPYSFVNYLSLTDALRHAAVTYRLSSIAVGAILAIIRKNTNGKVPKASRTLMKTPYKVGSQIKQIANGRLWYYGIEKVILNYFE